MIELRVLGTVDLVGIDAPTAEAVLRRPQRVALLTYLAIATRDGFARRDRVLAMFWPEQDDERARHSLRQSLHGLRTSLDRSLFIGRGDQEISVDPAVLRCDVVEVERLLDAGQLADALALHRGELLSGFFLSGAPEFDRWLESARDRLRTRCVAAAASLTDAADSRSEVQEAVRWARMAHELAPTDEGVLRRLATLLDKAGDRGAALVLLQQFKRRLAVDLEVDPAPATQALARELRRDAPPAEAPRAESANESIHARHAPESDVSLRAAIPSREHRERRWLGVAIGAVAVVAAVALVIALRPERAASVGTATSVPPQRSAVALRLYDEARTAWMHHDAAGAERLLRATLTEDSTFALALLHLGHVVGTEGRHAEGQQIQQRAVNMAPAQSDHERLLILTWYAQNFSDPRFKVLAETLAVRYPDDLDGQLFLARARRDAGDMLGALAPLRRVLAVDTAIAHEPPGSSCPACRAYGNLVDVLENVDSLSAAERVAREWTVSRPKDASAWETLSYELAIQDRYEDALSARQRASDLQGSAADPLAIAEILLRAGDFRTIEHIATPTIENGSLDQASNARFTQWQSLREQGRMREAMGIANEMQALVRRDEGLAGIATIMRAQSLYETGRFAESARVWDSVGAHVLKENTPASAARNRTMAMSHAADARAALGDTVALARFIDTVRADGARSGYARDPRMHHHVRGLLLALRGAFGDACDAFHESLYTASASYIRANLALGRACIDAQRPADAIVPLRGVLHGPTGAAGTYGTHTEAHELIARAFDGVGQRDSARVHYARVASAWSAADAPFRARGDAARGRLAELGGALVAPRPFSAHNWSPSDRR